MLSSALFRFALAALLLVTAAGCGSRSGRSTHETIVARIYVETRSSEAGMPLRLPVSELVLTVDPRPVLLEFDVIRAERVEGEFGPALMLFLTPAASRDFYRLTVTGQGRRLVLTLNGLPAAAVPITSPVSNGTMLFYPEVTDLNLAEVAYNIERTSAEAIQRIAQSR